MWLWQRYRLLNAARSWPRSCLLGHGRTSTPICKPTSTPTTFPGNKNASDTLGVRRHPRRYCPPLSTVCLPPVIHATRSRHPRQQHPGVVFVRAHSCPHLIVVFSRAFFCATVVRAPSFNVTFVYATRHRLWRHRPRCVAASLSVAPLLSASLCVGNSP